LLALLPLAGSRYAVDLATEVLIYALFALSLNVIIGFTGNISFGHAAYFAIGGYACAILLTTYNWSLLFALPAAVVLAWLVAAVVGYFCVRLTQIYFAMLTLAFAMLVWGVAFKWKEVTGGDDGFTGIKVPELLAQPVAYFYFTLVVIAAAIAAVGWYARHTYYVGLDKGQVAIFKGRPGGLLWFQPTLDRRTSLSEKDVPPARLPDVSAGKEEATRAEAQRYVNALRQQAAAQTTTTAPPAAPAPTTPAPPPTT